LNKISSLPRFAFLAACLIVIAAFVAGCNSHRDRIGDLDNDPSQYLNHDVTIAGNVTRAFELPLGIANVAAYRLDDGTGQIWVVTHAGAPEVGDKVGVKGRFAPVVELSLPGVGDLGVNVVDERERRGE
jgi:hypothetical protein